MTSTPADQSALLKEVLDAVRALQISQSQLASNVDSINGRVNILAGIKEVADATAVKDEMQRSPVVVAATIDNPESHDHADVPKSPSVTATEVGRAGIPSTIALLNQRVSSATSRIILT